MCTIDAKDTDEPEIKDERSRWIREKLTCEKERLSHRLGFVAARMHPSQSEKQVHDKQAGRGG